MLRVVGQDSLEGLIDQTIPGTIRLRRPLALPRALSERDLLEKLREIANKNEIWRSFLGMGYSDCITPPVIQRNVLENPGWYTQYTPYQAEISQGRLEALLNFQTMVSDLTALEIANASLLDEASAAAEAMHMMESSAGADDRRALFLSQGCHPQTSEGLRTRAAAHGIEVIVGDAARAFDDPSPTAGRKLFGILVQYPASDGQIVDYRALIARAHAQGVMVAMACDLLALALLVPPGELGADIALGSAQRFGVPLAATAVRTRRSSRARQSTCASSLGESSASAWTRTASPRFAWRFKRASSTSAERRRRATSARRRRSRDRRGSVRRLSRAEGDPRHRRARARDGRLPGARPARARRARRARSLLRHRPRRGLPRRGASVARRGVLAEDEPSPPRRPIDRHRARRDDVPRGRRRVARGVRRADALVRGARARRLSGHRRLRAVEPLPDSRGLRNASLRDRAAALHAHARVARPLARALDDPAGVMHDEAERDGRDDADHLGTLQPHPPVCAPRSGARATRSSSSSSRRCWARSPASPP